MHRSLAVRIVSLGASIALALSALVVMALPASATTTLTALADGSGSNPNFSVSSASFTNNALNDAVTLDYTSATTVLAADQPSISFELSGIQMANSGYYCNDSDPGFECIDFSLTGVNRSDVSVSVSARSNRLTVDVSWYAPFDPNSGSPTYVDLNASQQLVVTVPAGMFSWVGGNSDASAWTMDNNNWQSYDNAWFDSGIFNALPKSTVSFDANGGTGSMNDFASSYSQGLPDASFSRAGYAFLGWGTSRTGGVVYHDGDVFGFTPDASAATPLYAIWSVGHDVTPSTSGGFIQGFNPQPIAVSWVTTADIPQAIRADYGGPSADQSRNVALTFQLNALGSNDSLTRYANHCTTSPAAWCSGVTLTSSSGTLANLGKYVAAYSSNSVLFTFYIGSNSIPAGTTVTLNLPASLVNLGNSTWVNATVVRYNTTLELTNYAYFNAQASRSVSYDTAGGSAVTSGNFVGSIAQPTAPTKAGYTFTGWFAASSGGTALSFPYAPAGTGAVILYGRWSANSNTVTYDAQGGSSVSSGTFTTGGSVTLPSAPTWAGHTFTGWFAASSGGTALNSPYSPAATSGITLYAHWTANSYSVTYDTQGGSSVGNGSFTWGGSVTLPATPTWAGHTFDGWFTTSTGGSALGATYTPSLPVNITLYAHWSLSSRSITFDANGGTGSMSTQSSSSAALITTNTFERSGYYFDGWNTAANGSGTDYANGESFGFGSSLTLYAKWRSIPAAPTAAIAIQVPVGQPIANAPVALEADGLKDQTGYIVTVHSTPQIIDQGTIWSGRLNTTVRIPANLEGGWHRLVIEGTAADGTPWVETTFFQVSATGLLEATSTTDPTAGSSAALASTGFATSGFVTAAELLGGGLFFIAIAAQQRRRRSTQR